MLMSNIIAGLCAVLMFGALVWVVIMEHKGGDYDENSVSDKKSDDKEEE